MNSQTREQREQQIKNAIEVLDPEKFIHIGNMHFMHEGVEYDLSAADLKKIDTIVEKQLFVVRRWW
jgi:predicted NBD/HSP70 family sugar kinase